MASADIAILAATLPNMVVDGSEVEVRVKKYRDLFLPLGRSAREVTRDTAVFMATPHRRRLRRRERALEDLRLSRQCSPRQLASIGLKRISSEPAFLGSQLLSDDALASSSTEVRMEAWEAEGEEESSSEMDEKEELHTGVMRRAHKLKMLVNLKKLVAKQKFRYGRRRATDVLPNAELKKIEMENRVKTGKAAMDFAELFGRTLTNLTIAAPRCRHTWDHWTNSPTATPAATRGSASVSDSPGLGERAVAAARSK